MAKLDVKRRLSAILAADVVGYSRLVGRDEVGTLGRLRKVRKEVIEPLISAHSGRVVKLMGDGLLAEFSSVVAAVECAVAWQSSLLESDLRFRIGINLGDVIVEGDDIYGDGVNVAARLEGLAEPGGICASRAVFEQVRNRLEVACRDLGEIEVKNIAEPVHVYRILEGRVEARAGPASGAAPEPAKPPRLEEARGSIAVFPFDSLSVDPEDAYLAEGIAMEIISMLSRVPDLRVISRSATSGLRSDAEERWQAVRELRLRYVLTGSVRRAGNRVRVTAELSDAADRSQIWSQSYARELADVFAVQEEIAEAIVIAFGGEYLRAEWRRARLRQTDDLDAWSLVQRAKSQNLPIKRDATDDALKLVQRALALDPDYAGAHAARASILMQGVISGFSRDPAGDRAQALVAAERASELSANDPTVLRTLGNVLSNCGEHAKAVRALRRAVDLAPFDFHCWGRLARTLAYGGDAEELREGQAILDRILSAAPNHPLVPYWHYFKANACVREDRYEDAVKFANLSVEAQPGYAGAWLTLANALGQLGRVEDARKAVARAGRANAALTPRHLAQQISILAAGRSELAEKSLAGLRVAGLLDGDYTKTR